MNIETRLQQLEQQVEQLQQSETTGHFYDPQSSMLVIKAGHAVIMLPNNRRDPAPRDWPAPPPELAERLEKFGTQKLTTREAQ